MRVRKRGFRERGRKWGEGKGGQRKEGQRGIPTPGTDVPIFFSFSVMDVGCKVQQKIDGGVGFPSSSKVEGTGG